MPTPLHIQPGLHRQRHGIPAKKAEKILKQSGPLINELPQ